MPPLIEIAVDNLADALAAQAAGADRLEFCADLDSHGLSPRPALVAEFRIASTLPVAAMVRPRAGGFTASPSDHFLAPRQAEALLAAGADAIVFGFLNPDHTVDAAMTRRMVTVAGASHAVFHRAFDLAPDPFAAIDLLVELKVRRILTAGMSPASTAHALGLPCLPYTPDSLTARLLRLRKYQDHAAGRIEILPCGGIRADNAPLFLAETGATQLHSACRPKGAAKLDPDQVKDLVTATRERARRASEESPTSPPTNP
jgi:copper homeostasis protein